MGKKKRRPDIVLGVKKLVLLVGEESGVNSWGGEQQKVPEKDA